MTITVGVDKLIFTSGRRLYAPAGIVGISESLELTCGFEKTLDCWPLQKHSAHPVDLTAVDIAELADAMIARWQRLKAMAGQLAISGIPE